MTEQQLVEMIYDETCCLQLIQSSSERKYAVFTRLGEKFLSFGSASSENKAWSQAWQKTQERMIKKLES